MHFKNFCGTNKTAMDRTEEVLIDLMGDLDLALLADDHLETDLGRRRIIWLVTFFREKNWRKDSESVQANCDKEEGMMRMAETQKNSKRRKKKRRKLSIERIPLSYEWGEAIRTDMGKRLHDSMRTVKRRAAAVWGFVSGVVTMAVIALSFIAIIGKKKGMI
jgi:hypothetical protein